MCLHDLAEALENDLVKLEKELKGKDIYIEILLEEIETYQKELKRLKEELEKAERSKPVWEQGR
ncbi:hypothetical protein KNV66_gp32 [Bacillus phage DLc1]|uniref:Uncharacterized protein n=1 Tax=Bacillus phage DLc1 TaxID=2777318 RepID=A0A7M1RQT0_9CAUD|nr:hypothetical protein KNV66_gp32 [Bacillus phage DLc1]QOR56271.1 hypothetical protein [Bacillus phage DLc1]